MWWTWTVFQSRQRSMKPQSESAAIPEPDPSCSDPPLPFQNVTTQSNKRCAGHCHCRKHHGNLHKENSPIIQQFHYWVYIQKTWINCIKGIPAPLFALALLTTAIIQDQPRFQQQMTDKENVICKHSGILFSHKKWTQFCHLQQHGWNWETSW